jgi:hypothetical protein
MASAGSSIFAGFTRLYHPRNIFSDKKGTVTFDAEVPIGYNKLNQGQYLHAVLHVFQPTFNLTSPKRHAERTPLLTSLHF